MDPHLESTPMALEGPLQEAVYLALDRCTERRFGRIQVDLSAAHPSLPPLACFCVLWAGCVRAAEKIWHRRCGDPPMSASAAGAKMRPLFLPYLCHDLLPCKEGECYFSVLAAAYFGGAEQGVERAINR